MKVIRFFWRKMVFLLTHYDIDSMINLIFKNLFLREDILSMKRFSSTTLKTAFVKIHPDFLQLRFRQHGLRHDDGIRRLSLV